MKFTPDEATEIRNGLSPILASARYFRLIKFIFVYSHLFCYSSLICCLLLNRRRFKYCTGQVVVNNKKNVVESKAHLL